MVRVMLLLYTSTWWLLAAGVLVILLRSKLKTYFRCVWLNLRLPGPPSAFLLGQAHWLANIKRLENAATEFPKTYGSVVRIWISIFPALFIFHPKDIQKILSNSRHVGKPQLYKMMQNIIGPGLITSEGMRWKIHRKLMQPMFTLTVLDEFSDIFAKGGAYLVRSLRQQLNEGKQNVNVVRLVNEMIFSMMLEAVLGVPIDSPTSLKAKNESPYRRGGDISLIQRIIRPWLLIPAIYRITQLSRSERDHNNDLLEFTKKAIDERRKLRANESPVKKCFVDYLLKISDENPESFTVDDCAIEACTLMLAGQDSVGGAVAFALYLLARNKKEQDKAFRELQSIFGNSKKPSTADDLRRMTYMKCCVQETLRLYPSVPIIGRTLGEELKLGKWTIPEGTEIFISPFATHRLEEFYPNPEKFDPDRFDPIATCQRPPYSFLPFSAGPRNCIGYKYAEFEIKSILSAVLREFELEPVEGKETFTLSFKITIRATGGLWVSLKPRTSLSNQIINEEKSV